MVAAILILICVILTAITTYVITFEFTKFRIKSYLINRVVSLREDLFNRERVIDILQQDL